jgi:DNA (cytosine-5)-methyltransferase 1
MAAKAYYNENDPVAAHVLECLIKDRVIADGIVDRRSIVDVDPKDVAGFRQAHFFAGGGLWSVAARMAGWPDDRELWTGSCPCQGESLAGKRLGADDPRHLWPDFYRLIRAARPSVIVGEQVAAAAGTHWLDRVCADLEDEDYAIRAVDIPACAVDAPHQRQRLFWVAMADGLRATRQQDARGAPRDEEANGRARRHRSKQNGDHRSASDDEGLFAVLQSDADGCGRAGRAQNPQRSAKRGAAAERSFGGLLSDAARERRREGRPEPEIWSRRNAASDADLRNGSFWSDAEWIVSPIDGKARRAKPGIRFLVDGLSGRVDLWRIGGNAIVAPLAASVLEALMECMP